MGDLMSAAIESTREQEALARAQWIVGQECEDDLVARYLQGVLLCGSGRQLSAESAWHLLMHRSAEVLSIVLAHAPYVSVSRTGCALQRMKPPARTAVHIAALEHLERPQGRPQPDSAA